MKIRTLIVDDEPIARRRLHRLLRDHQDVEIAGDCATGEEAVQAITTETPDLVFLDVQMPGVDGFEVLRRLNGTPLPAIVFVTAFDQYAIDAFNVHALDYLLKPFSAERLEAALTRVREDLVGKAVQQARQLLGLLEDTNGPGSRSTGLQGERAGRIDRLLVKEDGRMIFLRATQIDWIEADGNYMKLHVSGETYTIRDTIGRLEQVLDPAVFLRVHRSSIVNLDSVRELHPWFAGDYMLFMKDGSEVKLSRTYRDHLMQRLEPGK